MGLALLLVPPATLAVMALALRRTFLVVTVFGPSMAPVLSDGDRVLVRRVPPESLYRGQIVVVPRPVRAAGAPNLWIVKRIYAIAGDPRPEFASLKANAGSVVPRGMLVLLGDNRDMSFDSREFGYVAAERVLGVVTRRLRPRARARSLGFGRAGRPD